MKTIALFGATGQTGSEFLKLALEKGYKLKALVRTPEKVNLQHENLKVLQGDVLVEADVEKTIKDTDIVVSLFGHVKGSPEMLQTNGTKNMIRSMKRNTINRIISLSGGGLPYEKDKPKFVDKMIRTIMKIAVPKVLNDAVAHAELLKKSDVDWIIVRAPRLTNDAAKGNYKEGWVGVNASTKLTRADLADFILKQVEDTKYNKQMPFVSN